MARSAVPPRITIDSRLLQSALEQGVDISRACEKGLIYELALAQRQARLDDAHVDHLSAVTTLVADSDMNEADGKVTLVVDVGGSHVKAMLSGDRDEIRFDSGTDLTPQKMLSSLMEMLGKRHFDRISIGVPCRVIHGSIESEPHNLGKGWVDFNFSSHFKYPFRLINDAAMQALGSYEGGRMLFLGVGTGLGSAMIVDGVIAPMELAHLPYRKHTYEYYVSDAYREANRKSWKKNVFDVIEKLRAALEPDYIVIGGGNAEKLDTMPPDVRAGDNRNAFLGGFRIWSSGKTGLQGADRP